MSLCDNDGSNSTNQRSIHRQRYHDRHLGGWFLFADLDGDTRRRGRLSESYTGDPFPAFPRITSSRLAGMKKLFALGMISAVVLVAGKGTLFAQQDIYCNCNKQRYGTPGECLQNCKGNRLTCTGCFLSPRCPALQGDKNLKLLYNRALFRKGLVPLNQAQRSLVAHIINHYYKPFSAGQINIVLADGAPRSFWAEIEPASGGGKPTLQVHIDLIWCSPAFLVSAVGHEMIHYLQSLRPNAVDLTGIDKAVWAFKELEASNWESGANNFNWKIGSDQVFHCLRQVEKDEVLKILRFRQWEVRSRIEEIVSGFRDAHNRLKRLERWLTANPWTRDVWLPANPNWKSYTAGPRPQ